MRRFSVAAVLLVAVGIAGCQDADEDPFHYEDPIPLKSVGCDGQSSVIVEAYLSPNSTDSFHEVIAKVQVKCGAQPVEGAEVEVRFWDGSVRKIVTGPDGIGYNRTAWPERSVGKEVTFRVIVNGEEMTQPAKVREKDPLPTFDFGD